MEHVTDQNGGWRTHWRVVMLFAASALLLAIPAWLSSASAQQAIVDDAAARLAQHAEHDATRVDILNEQGNAYLFVDPVKAEGVAAEARDLAVDIGYVRGEAQANLVLGRAYQFRGEYGADVPYLVKSYKLAESADIRDVMAEVLRNMGTHYFYKGNYTEALQHLVDALDMAKSSGSELIIASAYFSLGTIYNEIDNYADADSAFQEALVLFEKLGDWQGVAVTLQSLGEVRYNQGDYIAASEYLDRDIKMMVEMGDVMNLGYSYAAQGNVQLKLGNIDSAIERYEQAIELGLQVNDLDLLTPAYTSLGSAFQLKGEFQRAADAVNSALDLAKSSGLREKELLANQSLAAIYEDMGDLAGALRHLRAYTDIREQLYPADYSQKLAEVQAQFEMKEQEAEISDLRREAALKELEITREKEQTNLALGAGVLFFVILLALANGYVIKARSSRKVQEQNQQLLEVGKELERANRVKSDILANTSHEIRTPLNGILGLVSLLEGSDLSETQRSHIKSIEHSGRTLLHLVNDILDMSRIEAGKLEIEKGQFNVRGDLAAEVLIWKEQCDMKGISFEFSVADDVPENAIAAGSRISQVLCNYVSNAIKFTHKGGVRVEITADRRVDGGVRTMFRVTDTGIGIPKDSHHDLFERFSQIDTSSTRAFGGTGLGLAICKELVGLMGGRVGLESEAGKGSSFWFWVVLEDAAPETESPRERRWQKDTKPVAVNGHGAGMEILIAEDNEINQVVIEGLVARAGHSPEIVSDGQEVLEAIKDRNFDLILMDIQMPRIDGVTAAKWIRAMGGEVSKIPIIALTANAMSGDREKYMAFGFDDYIAKPIDPNALDRLLSGFAERSGKTSTRIREEATEDADQGMSGEARNALENLIDTL